MLLIGEWDVNALDQPTNNADVEGGYTASQLIEDLPQSASETLWILDAYGFLPAGLLMVMRNLGDRIGRRGLLMIAVLSSVLVQRVGYALVFGVGAAVAVVGMLAFSRIIAEGGLPRRSSGAPSSSWRRWWPRSSASEARATWLAPTDLPTFPSLCDSVLLKVCDGPAARAEYSAGELSRVSVRGLVTFTVPRTAMRAPTTPTAPGMTTR